MKLNIILLSGPTILPLWPNQETCMEMTCMGIFTEALFIIAPNWTEPKYTSTQEWINKLCYMYTIEHELAIQRNKILIYLTT